MAYKEFKQGEKANWYVVGKNKVRGHHIVTPYRSKPTNQGKEYIIVSGAKHKYRINQYGYATTKQLPEAHKTKQKTQSNNMFDGDFGFNFQPPKKMFRL